jgi:hypothetical protein
VITAAHAVPSVQRDEDEAALRAKEQAAKDHLRKLGSLGHFHYEVAALAPGKPDMEHTTVLTIQDVIGRSGPRDSFTDPGQATAHASIGGMGAGGGGAVLKHEGLYYAVKLKTEGFKRERMYRFQPADALVDAVHVATSEEGLVFKKFLDYEPDPERLKKQGAAATVAEPPPAADLRAAGGMTWGSEPGRHDPGQVARRGDQKAFVRAYFLSRALEVLAENEKQANGLGESFKPADPGKGGGSGTGVSSKAQALIDSSRKLLPAYQALLEGEAELDRRRALVERGRHLFRTDVTLRERDKDDPTKWKDETKKWFEWREIFNQRSAMLQTAKSEILSDAPMLAHLVPPDRIPQPGVPSKLAAGLVGGILSPLGPAMGGGILAAAPGLGAKVDEAYDIAAGREQLRGKNQATGSLLAGAGTADKDEAIRKQFKERLDAIKGAIIRSRGEILGGGIDPLSMSGLRVRVKNDMRNIQGTTNDLGPALDELLAQIGQKELAWDMGMMVLQVGLLFVPGGQFLSAVIGAAAATHDMSEAEKRWDVSQAAVNPTQALIDQQEAAYGRIMAAITMVLSFVDLGVETSAALKELETASKAKATRALTAGGSPPKALTPFEDWFQTLTPETQGALKGADPAVLETYRTMDPALRRALTRCGSPCIPIPHPSPAVTSRLKGVMSRFGIADGHPGLREYLHDMRGRGGGKGLADAATALEGCQDLDDVQRIFDQAIAAWAKERGGTATKLNGRWALERKIDGVVVREWEVGLYGQLSADSATNSFFQAHHGVQDAWAQSIPGYRQQDCPAILLRDSYAGSPHRRITDRQIADRASASTRTYELERELMTKDLKGMGSEVPPMYADILVQATDAYFTRLYRAQEGKLGPAELRRLFGDWKPL